MVHLGSPEDGARFFEERWPEARAVSDPDRVLFDAFGLGRGSWLQLVGPRTWAAGFRARRHGVGLPKGDPRVLAGSFAVKGAEVLDADGQRLRELDDGGFFGEVGLLSGTRSATVRAVTPCNLFVLHRSDFRKVLRDRPQFAKSIVDIARERYELVRDPESDFCQR